MAKARIQMMPWKVKGESFELPAYWCPVCKHPHSIPTTASSGAPEGWKDRWTWNGSMDQPTFRPSVRTYYTRHGGQYFLLKRNGKFLTLPDGKKIEYFDHGMALAYAEAHAGDNGGLGWGVVPRSRGGNEEVTVCHVHVSNGRIQILSDTPGPLGGQTIPLEEWDVAEYLNPKKREEQ